MISSSQIKEKVAFYLADSIPLDDFEDWFVENTWNIHTSGSKAAEVLTFAIEEALSEFSSGHISEDRLRNELNSAVHAENKNLELVDAPQILWSIRSSSPVARVPLLV